MNIIELAEQAETYAAEHSGAFRGEIYMRCFTEKFAELVAEQTHTNNKAKWYQEGYEAGQHDEREACIKLLEDFSKTNMVPVKDTWKMGLIAGANAIRSKNDKNNT